MDPKIVEQETFLDALSEHGDSVHDPEGISSIKDNAFYLHPNETVRFLPGTEPDTPAASDLVDQEDPIVIVGMGEQSSSLFAVLCFYMMVFSKRDG